MVTEYVAGICILIAVCTITPTVIMTVQSRKWMTKQAAGEGAYVVYFSPLYKGIGMVFEEWLYRELVNGNRE